MYRKTAKRAILLILIAVLMSVLLSYVHAHPFVGGGGATAWPTAAQYFSRLHVGINVNWLTYHWVTALYMKWRAKGVNIPRLFREEGFDHVRIRVSLDVVNNSTAIQLVKTVVEDCMKANITPIIVYTAPELRNNPLSSAAQKHFLQWWKTLAKALRGEPPQLAYELLIETSGKLRDKPVLVDKIYNETIKAIRRIDPHRVIIVTAPADRSSPFSLPFLRLPHDPWLGAEWHIYAGGPKPGPKPLYNSTLIHMAAEFASSWSQRTHIPVWMGAWRPNRYPKAALRSRRLPDGAPAPLFPVREVINFTRVMVESLCSTGTPYAVNADTIFFDYRSLRWYPSQRPLIKIITMGCGRSRIGTDKESS